MKIAFVSDSGTGANYQALLQEGVFSVPLQISDGMQSYQDIEELSNEEVYERLKTKQQLSTSLPAIGKIEELFSYLKKEHYDKIFAIPICKGLSSTMDTMEMIANQLEIAFESLDCFVTSAVQKYLITTAAKLYKQGMPLEEIKMKLQQVVESTNTFLLPNDLQHLKRGGRLTPLAATLGGLLKIKPILQINKDTHGKIDVFDKVRTMSKAMDKVIETMQKNCIDASYSIYLAHANDLNLMNILKEKMKQAFPNCDIQVISLVSVVGIHTGLGCQAVQYFKKL